MGHLLTIAAESYLPTDANSIHTGEVRPVAGTVFDLRRPKLVGRDVRDGRDEQVRFARGFDHDWVFGLKAVHAPRLMARVEEPVTGRVMEVLSDQPGLQFYSGNFLDGTVTGKSGRIYREGDALVLEPQRHPDTPQPAGPRLRPPRPRPDLQQPHRVPLLRRAGPVRRARGLAGGGRGGPCRDGARTPPVHR